MLVKRKETAVFFAPDISDVSTIKRADTFLAHGYQLLVFGFRRDNYNRGFVPSWPYAPLGRTQDRRYGRRIATLLAAVPRILARRSVLRRASFFYARNIDQLLLALLARFLAGRRMARVIYEVLDIQPAFVGTGWKARLLRGVERFALRRTDLLVVSSPGFLRHYFMPIQGYRKPWFLLENKLPANMPALAPLAHRDGAARRRHPYRWVVGYCGLIRGQATFDLIVRLAERLQGLVLFRFRGILTTVNPKSFADALARLDNLVYEGDYVNPRDLPAIYGDLDFAWAIDLEHSTHNSRWLLPCRFYEAGYFGVPCLTADGFEVGRLVGERRIGWTFDAPYEAGLVKFFMTLTQTEYDEIRDRLRALPENDFVAGADTTELIRMIEQPAVGDVETAPLRQA
jgi:succinoglycan biosynthesis protein ExoL